MQYAQFLRVHNFFFYYLVYAILGISIVLFFDASSQKIFILKLLPLFWFFFFLTQSTALQGIIQSHPLDLSKCKEMKMSRFIGCWLVDQNLNRLQAKQYSQCPVIKMSTSYMAYKRKLVLTFHSLAH